MDRSLIEEKLIDSMAKCYQIDSAKLHSDGYHIRSSQYLKGKNMVYLANLFKLSVISVAPEEVPGVEKFLESETAFKRLGADDIKKLHSSASHVYSYPYFIYEKPEAPVLTSVIEYELKEVSPENLTPLQHFVDSCTLEDIDDASIDLDDPDNEIVLIYYKNKPIGYAGYRIWFDNLGDVGILIHKEHRRKGLGAMAVSRITGMCLNSGYIPLYRTERKNLGSAAIVKKVGYSYKWEVKVFKYD